MSPVTKHTTGAPCTGMQPLAQPASSTRRAPVNMDWHVQSALLHVDSPTNLELAQRAAQPAGAERVQVLQRIGVHVVVLQLQVAVDVPKQEADQAPAALLIAALLRGAIVAVLWFGHGARLPRSARPAPGERSVSASATVHGHYCLEARQV